MPSRPARVTKSEILRALRAVKQFGEPHEIIIAPDGSIRITPSAGGKVPEEARDAADVVIDRLGR